MWSEGEEVAREASGVESSVDRSTSRGVCCVSTASRMLLRAGTQGGWYLLGERRADDAAVACS